MLVRLVEGMEVGDTVDATSQRVGVDGVGWKSSNSHAPFHRVVAILQQQSHPA